MIDLNITLWSVYIVLGVSRRWLGTEHLSPGQRFSIWIQLVIVGGVLAWVIPNFSNKYVIPAMVIATVGAIVGRWLGKAIDFFRIRFDGMEKG